jgi:hypothetical protein
MDVLCAGHIVYGGGSSGYISECDERDDLTWRCVDDHFSPDGGDPRLTFDRGRRTIRIEDNPPHWSLDIDLTTPPIGVSR